MKRRKLLTSAGVLAGATLTGCGGGTEETAGSEIGSEISSEIAAYTLPGALLPQDGHYQVEVVYGLMRAVQVNLISGAIPGINIGIKETTGTGSHKMGFAKLRVTNEPNRNYKALKLEVIEYWIDAGGQLKSIKHVAGGASAASSSNNISYTYYPENNEYQWAFFSADPALAVGQKRLFCRVSFFKLPIEEHYAFTDSYLKVIPNNAPIGNLNGTGTIRSQHLPTIHNHPNHESSVQKDPRGTHHDTIALQDPRQPAGFKMLVPTLHHATPELRPMLERVLHRHVARLGAQQATVDPINGTEDLNQHNLLSNELMRLVGGESLIENMKDKKAKLFAAAETVFGTIGDEVKNFFQAQLPGLLTSDLQADARLMFDDARRLQTTPSGTAAGISVKGMLALQCGGSVTLPNWPIAGVDLGVGVRFSVPIARWFVQAGNKTGVAGGYVIGNSGFEFSGVGILKLLNAGSLLSIDIEFTVNFKWIAGKTICTSFVFDPVLDVDLRNIVGRLGNTAFRSAIATVAQGPFTNILIYNPEHYRVETLLKATTERPNSLAALPQGGLPEACYKPVLNALNATSNTQNANVIKVGELSLLRFRFAHRDLGIVDFNANTPRWAIRGGSHGWCPGSKWIVGGIKRGETWNVGDIEVKHFRRFVMVIDAGMVVGDQAFLAAENLIPN